MRGGREIVPWCGPSLLKALGHSSLFLVARGEASFCAGAKGGLSRSGPTGFGMAEMRLEQQEFRAHGHFNGIFYVSALKDQGLPKLLDFLLGQARPAPWVYPPELVTTLSYVEQIQHHINTRLFKWFNADVPYKIQHQTVGWTPRLDGTLVIEHELIVQDSVVARMILGVRNTIMTRMRDQVHLLLHGLEHPGLQACGL